MQAHLIPGPHLCGFYISCVCVVVCLFKMKNTSLPSWYCWNIFYFLQTLTFNHKTLQNWPKKGKTCVPQQAHLYVKRKHYLGWKATFVYLKHVCKHCTVPWTWLVESLFIPELPLIQVFLAWMYRFYPFKTFWIEPIIKNIIIISSINMQF